MLEIGWIFKTVLISSVTAGILAATILLLKTVSKDKLSTWWHYVWAVFASVAIIVLCWAGLTNSLSYDSLRIVERGQKSEALREKELTEVKMQIIQEEHLGAVGWQTLYSANDKIVVYNYTHLLAVDISSGAVKLIGAIDLRKLGTNFLQGEVVTRFSFSPDGEHVVINNAGTTNGVNTAVKYLYLCNIRSGSVWIIGEEDYNHIVDGWSDNGIYYTYANKNGENIYICNVIKNEIKPLILGYGEIDQIYITNNGDILLGTNELFILKKNKKYATMPLNTESKAIGLINDSYFYLHKGGIYKYTASVIEHVADLGERFEIIRINNNKVLFSDAERNQVIAYDISSNQLFSYNIPYDSVFHISFSPDLTKCITRDIGSDDSLGTRINVIEYSGSMRTIYFEDIGLLGDAFYSWIDNNNLVKATHLDLGSTLGEFQIIKLNIENGQLTRF